MADTVSTRWVYPPNWSGSTNAINDGHRRMAVNLKGTSDGTGETNVVKVNISELKATGGRQCVRTVIEKIQYAVSGLDVFLSWHRNPALEIARFGAGAGGGSADGVLDFRSGRSAGLVDPGGELSGDILLTTANVAAGDTYDITIWLRLKGQ
jgi:hypothetical protein